MDCSAPQSHKAGETGQYVSSLTDGHSRSSEVSGRAGMRARPRLLVHRVNRTGGGCGWPGCTPARDCGQAPGTLPVITGTWRATAEALSGSPWVAGCSPVGLVAQAVHRVRLVQVSRKPCSTHPLSTQSCWSRAVVPS